MKNKRKVNTRLETSYKANFWNKVNLTPGLSTIGALEKGSNYKQLFLHKSEFSPDDYNLRYRGQ